MTDNADHHEKCSERHTHTNGCLPGAEGLKCAYKVLLTGTSVHLDSAICVIQFYLDSFSGFIASGRWVCAFKTSGEAFRVRNNAS